MFYCEKSNLDLIIDEGLRRIDTAVEEVIERIAPSAPPVTRIDGDELNWDVVNILVEMDQINIPLHAPAYVAGFAIPSERAWGLHCKEARSIRRERLMAKIQMQNEIAKILDHSRHSII